MAIKCVALDLDGTTLDRQGKLSPANRQAIEAAIAQGVHVVIASGRSYDTLPKKVLSIPGIQWAITCNGAGGVPGTRRGGALPPYHDAGVGGDHFSGGGGGAGHL